MQNIYDIIKNVEGIYESNTAFQVLKDFERVLDELDIYVYKNWENGELAEGPVIDRHWITCKFFWPRAKMPDPMGGKRLLDYDCKISYEKSHIVKPRKIRRPGDIRPGTKKGKLDRLPIWIVEIMMPKKLVADIYGTYSQKMGLVTEPAIEQSDAQPGAQPADAMAGAGAPAPEAGAEAGAEPAAAPEAGAI
tara:strand:+ start:4057 stop:4632 length:576 start_codon:yes stop_codon:yes gene_type:complete